MTLKSVVDLLNKQKIIEGMVRTQPMQRHELVEKVVHKKHLAELQTVLASLSVSEIGKILAALPLDDARLLWQQIEAERLNDILWEVSSSLGADLAGDREPHFHAGEVTAYELVDGRMRIVDVTCRSEMEGLQPIWVDVLSASKAERGWIARHFRVDLPDPEDVTDLEVSARFYQEEKDEVHLHSDFL